MKRLLLAKSWLPKTSPDVWTLKYCLTGAEYHQIKDCEMHVIWVNQTGPESNQGAL